MSLEFNAEQKALQETVREFFAENFPVSATRADLKAEPTALNLKWERFSALALFPFFSSADAGLRELAIMAFESGRALLPLDIVGTLFAGPYLCYRSLEDAGETELAARIAAGISRVYPLLLEQTALSLNLEERLASGECKFVANATDMEFLLCFRSAGEGYDSYLIKREDLHSLRMENVLDITIPFFSLTAQQVPFSVIRLPHSLSRVRESMLVLAACELAGIAARVTEMTSNYVKSRRQYGVPVGGFQAVAHPLADMYALAEAGRAIAFFAAWSADAAPKQLALAARAAFIYLAEHVPWICEKAIQLHGGIGFTWEFDLHLYLRRAWRLLMSHGGDGLVNGELVKESERLVQLQ